MSEHVVTIDNVDDARGTRARAQCSCGLAWSRSYTGAAAMTAFHSVTTVSAQHQREAA